MIFFCWVQQFLTPLLHPSIQRPHVPWPVCWIQICNKTLHFQPICNLKKKSWNISYWPKKALGTFWFGLAMLWLKSRHIVLWTFEKRNFELDGPQSLFDSHLTAGLATLNDIEAGVHFCLTQTVIMQAVRINRSRLATTALSLRGTDFAYHFVSSARGPCSHSAPLYIQQANHFFEIFTQFKLWASKQTNARIKLKLQLKLLEHAFIYTVQHNYWQPRRAFLNSQ